MANKIDIGALADTLAKELASYTLEVAAEVKKASDEVSKEMLSKIKADAPKRTGDYRKAMRVKKLYENDYSKVNRWYFDPKTGKYRLAHLLEDGHDNFTGTTKGQKQLRTKGGRTAPHPHIAQNEQEAIQEFERRVKEAIANAK